MVRVFLWELELSSLCCIARVGRDIGSPMDGRSSRMSFMDGWMDRDTVRTCGRSNKRVFFLSDHLAANLLLMC